MTKKIQAVVIGASGYTGAELIRLLLLHPHVKIRALVAESNAGNPIEAIYPHFSHAGLPDLVKLDEVELDGIDVAFCCMPHGTTQEVVKQLPEHLKIIDVSADFRLEDPKLYEEWYGRAHSALDLQKQAVYGLTERNREAIARGRLIACPGCYPTSILLPLVPLLEAGVISESGIIIDSKTGITGAGRKGSVSNLFAEINDSIKAYGLCGHRHMVEVEQEVSKATGKATAVSFTPHVVPMNRGILSMIYVDLGDGKTISDVRKVLQEAYDPEPFVHVMPEGVAPTTREVMGTNQCRMNVFENRIEGKMTLLSVIDNLTKGSSGQAIQNMNVMLGFDETTGLEGVALCP